MRLVKPNWSSEAQVLTVNEGRDSAHQEAAVGTRVANSEGSESCLVALIVTEGRRWMFAEKMITKTEK